MKSHVPPRTNIAFFFAAPVNFLLKREGGHHTSESCNKIFGTAQGVRTVPVVLLNNVSCICEGGFVILLLLRSKFR